VPTLGEQMKLAVTDSLTQWLAFKSATKGCMRAKVPAIKRIYAEKVPVFKPLAGPSESVGAAGFVRGGLRWPRCPRGQKVRYVPEVPGTLGK
jgi:hypothetical protein